MTPKEIRDDLIQELLDKKFLNEAGKVSPWIERKIDPGLKTRILDSTGFLSNKETPLKYRIFCVLNEIDFQPVCPECGNPTSFDPGRKKFQEFCSPECASSSQTVQKRRRKTNLERYGDPSNFASMSKEDRIKNSKKAAEAAKISIREKYGVSNVMELEEVRQKHSDSLKSKRIQETRLNSAKDSCLNKYGVFHHSQKKITNYDKYDDAEFIVQNFVGDDQFFKFQQFLDFFNIEFSTGYHRKIQLGLDHFPNTNDWKYGKKQKEIFQFIQEEIYPDGIVRQNDRTLISPKELDLVIPEKSFAIELDGLYWHSNLDNKNYHLEKTTGCEEAGYQLFHIFENEWNDPIKQNIWKSMISNRLGMNKIRIGARECEIRDVVSFKETEEFLNKNHIQGQAISSIRYGLYYREELVSLMTFVESRFDRNYDFEISRFCNKTFFSVVGSFSRLLSHFRKRFPGKSLVSYGNRRWTSRNKNVYEKNGGKLIGSTHPNYFYYKKNEFHSRFKFQKHKLESLLDHYDKNLSERQNVINNGYRVIYDSGNLKYGF